MILDKEKSAFTTYILLLLVEKDVLKGWNCSEI